MAIVIVGALSFFSISIVYILLVFGAPLGEFAMGGKNKVMPQKMRAVCGVSVLIQWFAIAILLQTAKIIPHLFSFGVTKGICIFFAVYLSVNVMMNGFSHSNKERFVMTPLSLITAVSYWVTALGA